MWEAVMDQSKGLKLWWGCVLGWLRYLQDPYPVARFQQMCGVARAPPPPPAPSLVNGVCLTGGAARRPAEGEAAGASTGVGGGGGGGDLIPPATSPHKHASAANGQSGRADWRQRPASGVKSKPRRKNSLSEETGAEFIVRNKLLYYLFSFGTELGNELFYITFFPFWLWNIDPYVGRRLIVIWVWVMYLGQCTKDIIRLPRPSSPPVVKVEVFYDSEYGMPSTHAMSGTAIPFALFYLTVGRWEYPYAFGLLLASCWCILVCVSRLYMGMHSILDVIVGILYSVLILIVFRPTLDLIDNFNLTYQYAPLFIISLHLAMGIFSFTLDTWSTSRGDTAQILGTGAGIACASHVNHLLGILPDIPLHILPLSPPAITLTLAAKVFLRSGLGVIVLLATRAMLKAVTIPLACKIFGISCTDTRQARKRMEVELPYRYITYGTVGFNALFLVPLLFKYVNLS